MIRNLDIQRIQRIRTRLNRLYGSSNAEQLTERMAALIGRYGVGLGEYVKKEKWNESSSMLITYGDMIQSEGERPLQVLKRFADHRLSGAISTIHILPFFPYSSDDGFSIINYRQVDPAIGQWKDVVELGLGFKLMFDLVLNHCSSKSRWFSDYVANIAPYRDYFIEMDPKTDLSAVTRPRALPLLTKFHTRHGDTHLWTTFSPDQLDLDFSNPDVLFEFLDILMFYIYSGAGLIRLDAIAYLWKQIGTSCIHLEQTHEVVRLMRDLLEMVAPETVLLTETNVPHEENVSYFSKGDEAHMIYQFSLPPLLLDALSRGDATHLTAWATALKPPPKGCAFLNFTASHDGIGVRPLQGILSPDETRQLVDRVERLGGQVSMKQESDGSTTPYELNITYFDALGDDPTKVTDLHVQRFICSQTVAMELQGVPAIYFNSLVAARNNLDGVEETGRARTINRYKWNEEELESLLSNGRSPASRVMKELLNRLRLRAQHKVFHPEAAQEIIDLGPELFTVRRTWRKEAVLCISNFSDHYIEVASEKRLPELEQSGACTDIISGRRFMGEGKVVALNPYQTVWLRV